MYLATFPDPKYMATYSIYNYSCDDCELVFYVSNDLLPRLGDLPCGMRGALFKEEIPSTVVDNVLNSAGLGKLPAIAIYKVDSKECPGYTELKDYIDEEERALTGKPAPSF